MSYRKRQSGTNSSWLASKPTRRCWSAWWDFSLLVLRSWVFPTNRACLRTRPLLLPPLHRARIRLLFVRPDNRVVEIVQRLIIQISELLSRIRYLVGSLLMLPVCFVKKWIVSPAPLRSVRCNWHGRSAVRGRSNMACAPIRRAWTVIRSGVLRFTLWSAPFVVGHTISCGVRHSVI